MVHRWGRTRIGRIDPNAPRRASPSSRPESLRQPPHGIVAGPDGNLWFTELADRIGRITPSGTVTEFSAGISSARQPDRVSPSGPDGNLSFTEFFFQRIGRINTALDPLRFADPRPHRGAGGADHHRAGGPLPGDDLAAGLRGDGDRGERAAQWCPSLLRGRRRGPARRAAGPDHAPVADSFPSLTSATRDAATVNGPSRSTTTGSTSPEWLVSGIFQPRLPGSGFLTRPFDPPAPDGPVRAPTCPRSTGQTPTAPGSCSVQDDEHGRTSGVIAGGWSLDIQTTGPDPAQVIGPPVEVEVPGPARTVTRLDVQPERSS